MQNFRLQQHCIRIQYYIKQYSIAILIMRHVFILTFCTIQKGSREKQNELLKSIINNYGRFIVSLCNLQEVDCKYLMHAEYQTNKQLENPYIIRFCIYFLNAHFNHNFQLSIRTHTPWVSFLILNTFEILLEFMEFAIQFSHLLTLLLFSNSKIYNIISCNFTMRHFF